MTDRTELRPGPDHIILVAVEDDTWVLQATPHVHAMLSGAENYPTPVFCAEFPSRLALSNFVARNGGDMLDLWSVNPTVTERLRDEGHLHAFAAPEVR